MVNALLPSPFADAGLIMAEPSPLASLPVLDSGAFNATGGGHLPQHVVLGAQKAATSSIFDMLKEAGLSCGTHHKDDKEKEAHFFDFYTEGWERWGKTSAAKLAVYAALYDTTGCERYMDATPSYLAEFTVPHRMAQVMPASWINSVRMVRNFLPSTCVPHFT